MNPSRILSFLPAVGLLACLVSPVSAYDTTWSRSDCATYSYHGLYERYVRGGTMGWIDNDVWDSPSTEGLDCSSYVCRCLAIPDYAPEHQTTKYPYDPGPLFYGVDHMVRVNSIDNLQPWDIWVWLAAYGGPSNQHTGLFVRFSGSYIVSREALNEQNGIVEKTWRIQDMVDWGCRYWRRENWNTTVQIPTVETNAASNVLDSSARLNGTLVSSGGGVIDERGFAWGTTSACDDGWIDSTTSNDTFNATLSGLNPNTRYYFQAEAHNSSGWGSGTVRSFTTAAPAGLQIIVDNGQSGTSYTGSWSVSGGPNPYGANSLWARDGATYTWSFTAQPAGVYEVFMWWTEYSSRGTEIPVKIYHADGTTSITINQQTSGGQWNTLGQYYFDGWSAVRLNASAPSPTSHCADAVKFVQLSAPQDIILDNGDSGTSSSGTWGVSGGENPYGDNSLWARDSGWYRWTFTPQQDGMYKIHLWWTQYYSRGTAVPVAVRHAGGTAQTTVNQQTNGGQWNVIGTWRMNAGQSYYVQVSTSGDGSTTCADAARIQWISN